ncbi:MAG: sigma-70 family RNA polymerase sigma factor [Ilumatobacteraceae bacterium]
MIPFGFSTVSLAVMHRGSCGYQDDTSDEALLAGIALADGWAVLVFVRRYQNRLFGLAIGIVGDTRLAEDVTQEAFIRIFRHAEVFDPRRGSVSAWALTITRHLAIDALRVRRDVPTDPEDPMFLVLMSNERAPEDVVVGRDDFARVRAALAELPIDQRRAVLLAAMYGRSAAEIASTDAIPLGTAKSRVRLGLARLREALEVKLQ